MQEKPLNQRPDLLDPRTRQLEADGPPTIRTIAGDAPVERYLHSVAEAVEESRKEQDRAFSFVLVSDDDAHVHPIARRLSAQEDLLLYDRCDKVGYGVQGEGVELRKITCVALLAPRFARAIEMSPRTILCGHRYVFQDNLYRVRSGVVRTVKGNDVTFTDDTGESVVTWLDLTRVFAAD